MATIKKVRVYTKSRENGEVAMVCINDAIHLSLKQLTGVGYSNPKALIGSDITVEYYKVGDELLNGKCTSDNTIVKSFEIEDTAMDTQFAKMANAGVKVSLN